MSKLYERFLKEKGLTTNIEHAVYALQYPKWLEKENKQLAAAEKGACKEWDRVLKENEQLGEEIEEHITEKAKLTTVVYNQGTENIALKSNIEELNNKISGMVSDMIKVGSENLDQKQQIEKLKRELDEALYPMKYIDPAGIDLSDPRKEKK